MQAIYASAPESETRLAQLSEVIATFAAAASKPSRPLDNTDFHLSWRKRMTTAYLKGALRELRGDDPNQDLLARTAARLLPVAAQ